MVVIFSSQKGNARRQDLAIAAVQIPKPRNANTYCPNYCCTGWNRIVVFSVFANKPEQNCVLLVKFLFPWDNFLQWIRCTSFLFSAFQFSPVSSQQALLASCWHEYHIENYKVTDGGQNLWVKLSEEDFGSSVPAISNDSDTKELCWKPEDKASKREKRCFMENSE